MYRIRSPRPVKENTNVMTSNQISINAAEQPDSDQDHSCVANSIGFNGRFYEPNNLEQPNRAANNIPLRQELKAAIRDVPSRRATGGVEALGTAVEHAGFVKGDRQ